MNRNEKNATNRVNKLRHTLLSATSIECSPVLCLYSITWYVRWFFIFIFSFDDALSLGFVRFMRYWALVIRVFVDAHIESITNPDMEYFHSYFFSEFHFGEDILRAHYLSFLFRLTPGLQTWICRARATAHVNPLNHSRYRNVALSMTIATFIHPLKCNSVAWSLHV